MPVAKKQTMAKARKPMGGGIIDRIAPIHFEDTEGIKVSLYGRAGTGKTTLWSTFPKPILAVMCSGKGELRSIYTKENRKTIEHTKLEESTELGDVTEFVRKNGKYNTVVLDHATGMQDLVLKEILGLDSLPVQKGWGLASQQQYGQCTLQCKQLLRGMLDLDCNVVIIAQEREFNVDGDGQVVMPSVGSALSPSLVGWLNSVSDYICQTFIRKRMVESSVKIKGKVTKTMREGKGVDFCLRTGQDPVYMTRFRVPKGHNLPDVIVDPTYDKIIKVIKGGD